MKRLYSIELSVTEYPNINNVVQNNDTQTLLVTKIDKDNIIYNNNSITPKTLLKYINLFNINITDFKTKISIGDFCYDKLNKRIVKVIKFSEMNKNIAEVESFYKGLPFTNICNLSKIIATTSIDEYVNAPNIDIKSLLILANCNCELNNFDLIFNKDKNLVSIIKKKKI